MDVARKAGVSNGTVHYYFETKDALIHAAFQYNYMKSVKRREWIIENVDAPIEQLYSLVDSYLPIDPDTTSSWRVWIELWAAALTDVELRQLNDTVYNGWRSLVRRIIQTGASNGVLNVDDPQPAADMLLGLMDGLALQVLTGSSHMSSERMRLTCRALIGLFSTNLGVGRLGRHAADSEMS